ncbi:MAG: DMT family transporter [Candidatus Pacearchaeota archaeon]
MDKKLFLPLLIVTLAEASIGVFVKLTGDAIPVLTLNFYRVLFASIFIFAAIPLFTKYSLKFPKNNWKDTLIVGVLIAAQISLFNWAMTLAPIANVVVLWSVAPFFVFIFSTIFLKEKPRKVHILIFLLAIGGIFIAKPFSGGHVLGNAIALFDGAIYAAMVTYLRNEGKEDQGKDIAWSMGFATLILLPALFISGFGDLGQVTQQSLFGLNLPAIVWAICLGIVSTGLAFFFISIVLRDINANIYSLVDIIVSPIVAALLGFLIFGEVPEKNFIIGGALLLASGAWLVKSMQIRE